MDLSPLVIGSVALGGAGVMGAVLWVVLGRRPGPPARATFQTLHTASLAAPALRGGLGDDTARRAAPHLRALLGAAAAAVTDGERLLAWDGAGDHHAGHAVEHAGEALRRGRASVLTVTCRTEGCPVRRAVVVPLTVDGRTAGSLAAYAERVPAALVRAVQELGRWTETQLELADLDRSRTRLAEAEIRALRAQISPHFVYNSLTTIASFVRTDPERARELLLEFADFTRYSFRRHGAFTTLAEELRSIDRYLLLQRARFGDHLRVTLRIAPEALHVAVPFLCLQPLVENAVRHGLQDRPGRGRVTIVAEDAGTECVISVADDGVGIDPERLRRALAGEDGEETGDPVGIGLANVDLRMRQVYGEEYGLAVETAVGAGTKVTLRVPKDHPGVAVSAP
ncbi:sensor histidine kinase [Spirillospora sp. CA-294931]|uniref:sensor histidine kinase n=1 Tax=Spirillospora sp. CA-294931 TaxID=3240042 RepID=UPI003D8FC136